MKLDYFWKNGHSIMIVDYSKCKSNEEILDLLEQVRLTMLKAPKDYKFLVLNDVTNQKVFDEFVKRADIYAKEVFNQKTLKSAMVGINSFIKIILNLYNTMHGGYQKVFNTKEDALKYLTENWNAILGGIYDDRKKAI